jgi:hypothetical protein
MEFDCRIHLVLVGLVGGIGTDPVADMRASHQIEGIGM